MNEKCDFCGGAWFAGYDGYRNAPDDGRMMRSCAYCDELFEREELGDDRSFGERRKVATA